ncbi:MAG: hypothetical protein E6Q88_09435 [Lysobacteraceae bacterium]|nr:MAG: hypothetical protein E6Q88_09435 [Xanthomonadaceae bacterium]
MKVNDPKSSIKTRPRKIFKNIFMASLCLFVAILACHFAWLFSGSGRWELLEKKDGIAVYSLKTPGIALKKFKAVMSVQSSLSAAVKIMQDPHFCDSVGCMGSEMIERVDDKLQYYYFKWAMPLFFKTRDFVVKSRFSQDPATKAVLLQITAVPERIPLSSCCFRIVDMNNSWRFIPQGNGDILIEYMVDTDQGGFFPYFLSNMAGSKFMHSVLIKTRAFFQENQDAYRDAKFDFLEEA